MKYYSIGEFSKLAGITQQTLRNWDKVGKLKPHHIPQSGYRYYSQDQLNCLLGLKQSVVEKKTIVECRVSSNKQKDDLERQIDSKRLSI